MIGVDWGVVLMLAGTLMLCITPAERTITSRKTEAGFSIDVALVMAFPAPASSDFGDFLDAIDAAIENDPLVRGTGSVAEIYEHARRRD